MNDVKESRFDVVEAINSLSSQVGQLCGQFTTSQTFNEKETMRLRESMKERDQKLEENIFHLTQIIDNQQKQMDKQDFIIQKHNEDIQDLKNILHKLDSIENRLDKVESRQDSFEKKMKTDEERLQKDEAEAIELKKTRVSGWWTAVAAGLPGLIAAVASIILTLLK